MTLRHLVYLAIVQFFVIVFPALDASAVRPSVPNPSSARSPIDVVITADGRHVVVANQTSDSLSLIRTADGTVVDELPIGDHPTNLAATPDGKRILATASWSGTLHVVAIEDVDASQNGGSEKLVSRSVIRVGMHPHGMAVSPDSNRVYIGLAASGEIAEVDLSAGSVTRTFAAGAWPRYLAITPDGKRLAVGLAGESAIGVIDTASGETLYREGLSAGINLGQMAMSGDGTQVYFPWMVYRTNPINVRNIKLGWVLASRLGRVRTDGPAYREAVSLDVPEQAVADSHDIVLTSGETHLVASSSGTHELLRYRLRDLPFIAQGGPGDLIDPALQYDEDRFARIEVGGRPMGMAIADDDKTVYVANFLRDSVQVVDIVSASVVGEIRLSDHVATSPADRGREIFYDAEFSLDQWYSCHTCHQDGGTNSRIMDTMNDGTEMTFKTVLPLFDVTKTSPWTWHGWQTDLTESMHNSVVSTMQGKSPSDADKRALIAYLETLSPPPNPYRGDDGVIGESAERGRELFASSKAACIDCHRGPHLTDGEVHDVGTGSKSDYYDGYNTPSLIGTYGKVRWMHHGRAKSLREVLTDYHRPEDVHGEPLSDHEVDDLISYLQTL
jgi:DNA-binding beta-propeller fold protein YncE